MRGRSREDQSRTNATCYNCHDAHYVYPQGSTIRAEWRLNIPNVCGNVPCEANWHAYATSVHGKEVLQQSNPERSHLLGLPHHSRRRESGNGFDAARDHQELRQLP